MKSLVLFITTLVLQMVITYAFIPTDVSTHMNTTISPCEDFYQYSCGKWISKTDLYASQTHAELFDPLYDDVDDVLQGIINEEPPLIGELWDSCMDIDKINALGNKPLEADLHRIAGAKSRTSLFELMGELSRTGTQAIVMVDVEVDRKDATKYTLLAKQSGTTLPSSKYYAGDRFRRIQSQYREYINNVIKLSGFSISGRSAAEIVIKIEESIHDIRTELKSNKDYPHFSIKAASKKWPRTFGAFYRGMSSEKSSVSGWSLSSKKEIQYVSIQFENVRYFDLVEKLVQTIPVTNLKVYMAFVFIHSRIQWLNDDFLTAHFRFFDQALGGRQKRMPRSNFCRARISEYLPQLIGHKYAAKVFDQETETSAIDLVKRIKKVMKHRISTLKWLDEPTRNEAKAKLENLKFLIGASKSPPRYTFALSHEYYAANIYTILMDLFNSKMKKVNTPVNRDEWDISPATVNAHYVLHENKVVFPTAILQPPMLDGHDVHPARNFGAIGATMGHEMTHGFDTLGRRYDAIGNKRAWWTQTTMTAFSDKANCFEDLYSSFKMYGKHRYLGKVDGTLTLDENIADSGGVSLAWDAYREYMTTVKPNTYDATRDEGDQMFFIAYAQSFCSRDSDEYIQDMLIKDTHAPSQWRINGVVMNNDDFAKVFKCDVNTPMNPISKCTMW